MLCIMMTAGGLEVEKATSAAETVKVAAIDIAYKSFGEGHPLILIMGSGSTMDLWPPKLLSNLSSYYRVIVFDNRGMGYTTGTPEVRA